MGPGRAIALILTALQFLTRLPLPDPGWEDGRLRAALGAFPVAGCVVGAIGAVVWWGGSLVFAPAVAAGLAIAAMLLVTGALHEDGLGDVADGLGATRDPARSLEIMRDSRIGSYALVAVLLSVGLRWAALASLGPVGGVLAILISATASRAAMVLASRLAPPARREGLGAMLGQGASAPALGIALGFSFALGIFGGVLGVLAVLAACAVAVIVCTLMRRRVGGMTGDGYGAVASLGETAALVVLSAGALGAAGAAT